MAQAAAHFVGLHATSERIVHVRPQSIDHVVDGGQIDHPTIAATRREAGRQLGCAPVESGSMQGAQES